MEQILLRAREAAELCSVKEKTWRAWNQLGKIPKPVKLGRLQFWRHDELLRWIEAGSPNRKFWEACRFTADRASARRENPLPLGAGVNKRKAGNASATTNKESRPNTKTHLASSRKQGKV